MGEAPTVRLRQPAGSDRRRSSRISPGRRRLKQALRAFRRLFAPAPPTGPRMPFSLPFMGRGAAQRPGGKDLATGALSCLSRPHPLRLRLRPLPMKGREKDETPNCTVFRCTGPIPTPCHPGSAAGAIRDAGHSSRQARTAHRDDPGQRVHGSAVTLSPGSASRLSGRSSRMSRPVPAHRFASAGMTRDCTVFPSTSPTRPVSPPEAAAVQERLLLWRRVSTK